VFFGYIIFDVQHFLSEKTKISTNTKEDLHIEAAINIYLDVINIFLRVMEIIARLKGESRSYKKAK
jgi:FtsH-binding integral membrane protein